MLYGNCIISLNDRRLQVFLASSSDTSPFIVFRWVILFHCVNTIKRMNEWLNEWINFKSWKFLRFNIRLQRKLNSERAPNMLVYFNLFVDSNCQRNSYDKLCRPPNCFLATISRQLITIEYNTKTTLTLNAIDTKFICRQNVVATSTHNGVYVDFRLSGTLRNEVVLCI